MSPLFALLLLCAAWTAQGNVIGVMEQTEEAFPDTADYEESVYDNFNLDDEYDYTELDNDMDEPAGDLAEIADEPMLTDLLADLQTEVAEGMVSGCRGNRCEFCYGKSKKIFGKKFGIKICASGIITRSSVEMKVTLNKKQIFSKKLGINGNTLTFTIPRSTMPSFARRLLRSGVEIKLSKINLQRRKFCVRVSARVKVFGRIRSPELCR